MEPHHNNFASSSVAVFANFYTSFQLPALAEPLGMRHENFKIMIASGHAAATHWL